MIEYTFNIDIRNSTGDETPVIIVSEESISGEKDYMFLTEELNNLSGEYVRKIVKNLEEVKKGKRDKEVFGFETTSIWCYMKGKGYYGEKYPDTEVIITYDYADAYIVTSLKIDDILKMMTDWRDYIDAWEKETGKKKNNDIFNQLSDHE